MQAITTLEKEEGENGGNRAAEKEVKRIIYGVNDNPPWYLAIILGLQHYLTMLGGTVSIFLIVTGALCIDMNLVLKAEMLATVFFVMGITTICQATFGSR